MESYRRASEAGDAHLSDSTAYFNSRDLHSRIQHEIQQEKAIQDRLASNDYTRFTRSPPAPAPTLPSERKPTETIKYEPNAFESP